MKRSSPETFGLAMVVASGGRGAWPSRLMRTPDALKMNSRRSLCIIDSTPKIESCSPYMHRSLTRTGPGELFLSLTGCATKPGCALKLETIGSREARNSASSYRQTTPASGVP